MKKLSELNISEYAKLLELEFKSLDEKNDVLDITASKLSLITGKSKEETLDIDWDESIKIIDDFSKEEIPDEESFVLNGVTFLYPKESDNIKTGENISISIEIANISEELFFERYLMACAKYLIRPAVSVKDVNTGKEELKRFPYSEDLKTDGPTVRENLFKDLPGYMFRKAFNYFIKKKIG